MQNKELSIKDTKMIQALSVMAMVCLHLFCTLDYQGKYIPLVYFKGIPLCFYVAQICDFCVFGFAFCSGYGHMKKYTSKEKNYSNLKSLLRLLVNYWIVLVIFSGISVAVGNGSKMPKSAMLFILNALTISNAYNGAWWYIFAYIIIVLISPLVLKCIDKNKWYITLGIGGVIYCISYWVRFYLPNDIWLYAKLGPLGMTLFEYILGVVCCKEYAFSKIYAIWRKIRYKSTRMIIAICIMVVVILGHTLVLRTLFIAPVTGGIIITLFHFWEKPNRVEKAMIYISKHSTNIWLTHMFFYFTLFENLVFKAKYPPLIFLFMMCICLLVSLLLQVIQKRVLGVLGLQKSKG